MTVNSDKAKSRDYFVEYRSRERVRARKMAHPFYINGKTYSEGDYEVEKTSFTVAAEHTTSGEEIEVTELIGMTAADFDAKYERSRGGRTATDHESRFARAVGGRKDTGSE